MVTCFSTLSRSFYHQLHILWSTVEETLKFVMSDFYLGLKVVLFCPTVLMSHCYICFVINFQAMSLCFFDLVTMRQIVFLFYFLYNDNREKMNTNIFLPNNITIILINQSNTVFHIAPFKIHLNRNQCNDVTE
jgi:hypothetical protein